MDFLDAPLDSDAGTGAQESPVVKWDPNVTDPRLKKLSYSSRLLLHSCPRKYQLYRLRAKAKEDETSSTHFAYGDAVGGGVQFYMANGKNLGKTLLHMWLQWPLDFLFEDTKRKKSLHHAMAALIRFDEMIKSGYLQDYEVAIYDGKPAIELSFLIHFPEGYTYRGFVDIVLRHQVTGEIIVLELKTDGGTWANHYKYKNSAQAIGYSVVLDKISPGISAYTVYYLVYMAKLERFEPFEFAKTYNQRALWLRDIVYDLETVEKLVEFEGNEGIWPQHGESCASWGKPCEYMDICHLQTPGVIAPLREKDLEPEDKDYQFVLKLEDLM